MEGRVEGESGGGGGHVVVTCSRHLAEGPRAAWGPSSLLRSCVDCHFKSGREGTRVQPPRAEGSDTASSSSRALSLSLPVVLPPTSWWLWASYLASLSLGFPVYENNNG